MYTKFAWTLTTILCLCFLALLVYTVQPSWFQQQREPHLYLLPEGFLGAVTINYGQEEAPPLPHEGEYLLFEIPRDGVLNTSTPEPQFGLADDKFYYVDRFGHRSEVKPHMIQGEGVGTKQELRDGMFTDLPPVQYFTVHAPDVMPTVSETLYPAAFMWTDSLYLLSAETISPDQLGSQLGEVKRQVHEMPYVDGESNALKVGSRYFAIKSFNQYEAIAVEQDGVYTKALRQESYR